MIVYCFRGRRLWGSKLHAGYSMPLRFYLEWSAIWGRCLKIRVRPYYNGYMTSSGALERFKRSLLLIRLVPDRT